ncbi:MAG TPA: carbon starvation CstA family protein [Vicinamibacterales bacterium]|nr:carbon starvation CstA family protein [Vicinamibacterales bacterium]
MSAVYVVLPALAVLLIAYRVYSAFLASRVFLLDDSRPTPAHTKRDGHNFHPTSRWVLFGHHFAAIAGPGPLLGPVLALQFGFAPGLLWLVAGVCLAGAVHDYITLWASTRRGGASLAEIARMEIGPVAGFTAAVAILLIVIIALAGVGVAFVNALSESPWGVFTIAVTIPLALFMSLYIYRLRPGKVVEATTIGVIGLIGAVVAGRWVAESSLAQYLTLSHTQLVIALGIYGFLASVLPVWLLLTPRDYLSAFMKVGVVAFLVIGVILVNPTLEMPAITQYASGGGPIVPGALFPFAFITIACGSISGFHSLVASGTTPKMIDKESDIRPIGYGAMLMEGLVGIMALVAAASMHPGDYFAINTPPAVFQTLGHDVVDLPAIEQAVGENVEGRTGGAVTLAIGMAQIFAGLPGMSGMVDYWYHFAIMFEALFILTVIDAGTRVGRFIVGEFIGRAHKPFARPDWKPGAAISTGIVVVAWGYFIWTGNISTIWPMFGIANQLLASVALAVGTTILINMGRARFAWVTIVPMTFLTISTLTAGFLSVRDNFWPMATGANEALRFQGMLNSVFTVFMMVLVVIILGAAIMKWLAVGRSGVDPDLAVSRPA